MEMRPYYLALHKDFKAFRNARMMTLSVLNICIETIDWHHHNGKIATTSGSAAGIVGGLVAFGGLMAAPFTGGISLFTVGAGSALAVGGAITQFGSDMACAKFIENKVNESKSAIAEDEKTLKILMASGEALETFLEERTK